MNKKIPIVAGSLVLLSLVAYFAYSTMFASPTADMSSEGIPTVTIVRTNDGYVPSEVTIKKGDIVQWKNESSEYHWPASDLHPTHAIYPEFDPLKPIAPGASWQFKFDKVGTWHFHDHIRANKTGTVTVTE